MAFRIADGHVHLENVEIGAFDKPQKLLDTMAHKGVTDASLLAFMPFCDVVSNLRVLYWKDRYKRMALRAFGCFHETDLYRDIPYEKQYETLMDLGCDGIKFIQMKPDRRRVLGKGLNHPSYDRALSAMEERGTPVVIHSGDPETFWDPGQVTDYMLKRGWFYGDGKHLSCDAIYAEDFEMLEKHPKLRVTFAHFFFLSNKPDEARRVMDRYENVNFDLTPGWEMYLGFSRDIDRWQTFFEEYADRIQFGTDSNDDKDSNADLNDLVRMALTHDKSEFEMPIWGHRIKGLDLSAETVEKICYKNYLRFVGERPRQVNRPLFYQTAQRMLSDIRGLCDMAPSIQWIEDMILCDAQ
ncbi:MAG: amidohydrolase family protein [Clostridia bacterium]|nr:amidohydrolase family protein [Clostridia bacterium]